MGKSPDFGPIKVDSSQIKGKVESSSTDHDHSERKIPPKTPRRRKLTPKQKFAAWATAGFVAAAAAGGAAAAYFEGSGESEPVNPTMPSITETVPTLPESTTLPPVTTTTELTTTTTKEKPTTTTTESTTTTTTEQKTGIDKEFISTEKTLEDVTGVIEKGELIEKPIGKIPADLQELFASKTDYYKIVWVGENNRGDEGNAILTTKGQAYSYMGEGAVALNFFGGHPMTTVQDGRFNMAQGIFKDIVEIPDSQDFYMRCINPLTEKDFYVRVLIDLGGAGKSFFGVFNFQDKYQNELILETYPKTLIDTDHFNIGEDFLKRHKFSEFVKPGDMVLFNLTTFKTYGSKYPVGNADDLGVQTANYVRVDRLNGADEIYNLFKGGEAELK